MAGDGAPPPNGNGQQHAPLPPYWALAISYALCYAVLAFAVEWLWDTIAGQTLDVGATAKKSAMVAVFFGLTMAWFVPWLRRRR